MKYVTKDYMVEGGGGTQCKSTRFYSVPVLFSLDFTVFVYFFTHSTNFI